MSLLLLLVGTIAICAVILSRRKRAECFPFRPKAATLAARCPGVVSEVMPRKVKSSKPRRIAPHPPLTAPPDKGKAEGAIKAAERWTKGLEDMQSLQVFTMRQERIGRELEKHDVGKMHHPPTPRSQHRLILADVPFKGRRAKGSISGQEKMRVVDVEIASSTAEKNKARVDLLKPVRLPADTDMAAEMLLEAAEMLLDEAVRLEATRIREQPRQLVEASRNLVWLRNWQEAGRSSPLSAANIAEGPPTDAKDEVAVSSRSEIRDAVVARMSDRVAETVTETVQSTVRATMHCDRGAQRVPGDNSSLQGELSSIPPPRRGVARLLAGKGILPSVSRPQRKLQRRVRPSAAYTA